MILLCGYRTYLIRLKQREEERRNENLRLKEESEAEIKRILQEIEEENEMNKTKVRLWQFCMISIELKKMLALDSDHERKYD